MEDEERENRENDFWMRWLWPGLSIYWSFAALQTMWTHGLRSWDWVQNAALGLMAFSCALSTWQKRGRDWSWQSTLLSLTWGTLLGLAIWHQSGWVPGASIIALFFLGASARKSGWWSIGIRKPLGILELALIAVVAGWFIRGLEEWLPFASLISLALLLGSEKEGRRSIRENLWRPASVAWISTAGAAFFWLWKDPSFASVVISLAVPVLWFGNFLMHLSSEEPLALPHPQS